MVVYEMEEKESLDTDGIIGDIKRDEHADEHASFQLSPENYDHRNLYNDANDNYVMPCTGHNTESYWDHWYPEIDDDSCTNVNGVEQCIYDFTDVASNGGLEIARDRCMDNGGILYTFDGAVTCPDGSSYTFVNEVLDCFFGCDARSAEYTTKVDLTADLFLANMGLIKKGCSWVKMIASAMEQVIDDDGLISRLDLSDKMYTGGKNDTLKYHAQNYTYEYERPIRLIPL